MEWLTKHGILFAAVAIFGFAPLGCSPSLARREVVKGGSLEVKNESGGWTHPQDVAVIALIREIDSTEPIVLLDRTETLTRTYPDDARLKLVRVLALVRLGRLGEAKRDLDELFAGSDLNDFVLPNSSISLYAELAQATGTSISEPIRLRTITEHRQRRGFPAEPTEAQIIARIFLAASTVSDVGDERFYYVRRALELSPDNSLAWLSFAGGCRMRGYFAEAADAYRRYAEFGEADPFVSNNLSVAGALRAASYCENLARTRPKQLEPLGGYRYILPTQSDIMAMRPLRGLRHD